MMYHPTENHSASSSPMTFAVVGAGVVGLCVALEAQRAGYKVTLVDEKSPGTAASSGNAGYLATEIIDPLGTPEVLRAAFKLWLDPNGPICTPVRYAIKAAPWYWRFVQAAQAEPAQRGTEMIHQLNRLAADAWRRTLTDIGADALMVKGGHLVVWQNPNNRHAAQQLINKMQRYDIACELVEGQTLAQLEPELSETLSHAVFFPDIYRLSDPYEVCRALFAAFLARGGYFIHQRVHTLKAASTEIQLGLIEKSMTFDKVAICGGAWSKSLLEQVDIHVPLEAERGYHVTFPNDATRIHHTILSAERKLVLSPLNSGLRAVGMSEIGGVHLPPIQKRYQVLRAQTQGLLPKLFDNPALQSSEWMGHRPSLPDSLPVIDLHPHYPRLCFAFGHQHLGITQAAISAELLLAKVEHRPTAVPIDALRVNRF